MKRVLAILIFSGLLFNSMVFAQKGRSANIKTSPVSQSDFVVYGAAEGFSDGGGVWLRWQTASETKTLGFHIYRAVGKGKELVSDRMVGGGYLAGEEQAFGRTYTFFDPYGSTETVYYVEGLSLDGQKLFSNPIFPQYISDLKRVANASSEVLKQARESSQSEIINTNLVMPKELESTITENRLPADLAMQRFIAGQPGVKLGVRKEGVFRVTKTELQNAGFDVNSSPALWQLYRDGVEQSMIVAANGDYIEFYGQGLDTPETATQIYYLIVGAQNGKRIGTSIQRPFAGNVVANSFFVNHVQKQRLIYTTDPLNGELENFFDNRPIVTGGATIPFTINSIDFNVRKVSFTVAIQGITFGPHSVRVILNGTEIGLITGTDKVLMSNSFGIISNSFAEGTNTLQLISAEITDVSFLESIALDYGRLYKAQNNQLGFYTNPYRASNLGGFASANIRVFDMNYPDDPTIVQNLSITQNGGGDYSVRLPANRSHLMFAVEDSAVSAVATIGPNVPSTLFGAVDERKLVIITYKDWITQANTWADYRRSVTGGSFTVEVVNIEDIYDEFSYGAQSTNGIKNFLLHAKNIWQTKYALLLGDASYDYRNYEGNGYNNYVPTKLVDTVYMETGADEALADFDNDGLAEIAVGRITAKTPADVTLAYNKTVAFEPTVPQWTTRGGLFVSDMPIGYDFEALSHRVRDQLPAGMPITFRTRIDCVNPPPPAGQTTQQCLDNQRNEMLAEMNTGKYLVNYSGHGSTGFWAVSSTFFSSPHAFALTNGNNLSLYTMLTCLNGYFLTTGDSLAENLMKAPNGGSVATWTSTGKTTPDMQEVMATRFYGQMTAGNMPRIGDLIKDAKIFVIGGRDVRLSWVLLGDPALKVR
jgi:hypothetical protein